MAKVFTITEGLENMGALRTGGQGSVYKGKRMGSIISAVKLLPTPIHTENKDDKNFRDFQNEVEKLKKVNEDPSPNVVKILNSGLTESGSFPFIEMEYIEGPDLEDLLKPPHEAVFTVREAIKLAEQLSDALAHCHKVGVKHGDIKSNNVKFNQYTGNYVLLDFGLAVMSDEQRRSSLRHAGAVEFMAPEQHEGEMLFQSDIYSFGIILYELLAGTVPFPLINKSETSRNMVMLSHIEKPMPDLLELRKAHLPIAWSEEKKAQEMLIPSWLLQVVDKCLQKKPDQRFADGMELHDVISNHHQLFFSNEEAAGIISELRNENARLSKRLKQTKNGGKIKIITVIGAVLITAVLVFGLNATFNTNDTSNNDTPAVVDKTNTRPTDSAGAKAPLNTAQPNAKTADSIKKAKPKKVKRTKDGLIDDVPEF